MSIHRIPALKDNYIWLIRSEDATLVVDPAEADPVSKFLEEHKWKLSYILNTHHHWDHVGGNLELKERYACKIVGCELDRDRIPGMDLGATEGEPLNLGLTFEVLYLPGHTHHHIAYFLREQKALFSGDVLFGMGCGRLFEGTPAQMFQSLEKIKKLPPDTKVFCAHEYTLLNGTFSEEQEPQNEKLKQRMSSVRRILKEVGATVPLTLSEELETNPFLRSSDPEMRKALRLETSGPVKVFTELRRRKDVWKS